MVQIAMYILLAFLMIRLLSTTLRTKGGRILATVVNNVQDKEAFFEAVDNIIETDKSITQQNKARIIKLWGLLYHKEYDKFLPVLEDLDINTLFSTKGNKETIANNEDSFFYLLLSIPNMLYAANRDDLQVAIDEKVKPYDERLKDTLLKNLSDECIGYYRQGGETGKEFFQDILDGNYAGYEYTKSLIGLYKAICNAMLAKMYKDQGNEEAYEEAIPLLQQFSQTGVGTRWLKSLGLDLGIEEDETFELSNNPTEKTEEKVEEPQEEEKQEEPKE